MEATTMNREEIEAAAKRNGVRITGWDGSQQAWMGTVHRLCIFHHGAGFLYRAWRGVDPLGPPTDDINEAFAAIAADIDKIRSARVERTAEDERAGVESDPSAPVAYGQGYREGYARCTADVVAWLGVGVEPGIERGAHVGAADTGGE